MYSKRRFELAAMLFRQLETYRKLVILTGSELSATTGAPSLCGASGLWQQPETAWLADSSVLEDKLVEMWRTLGPIRHQILKAEPGEAYHALAWLENRLSRNQSLTLITYNADGLHQRAGSSRVIELYGSLISSRCTNSNCQLIAFEDHHGHEAGLAYCPLCRAPLRPNIRFRDEPLPVATSWQIHRVLQNVDIFMVIGVDTATQSLMKMIWSVRNQDAHCILINPKTIPNQDDLFDQTIIGPLNELIPRILGSKPKASE